ncbi:MAG TPA: sigma-70 family RNA polymerase sigma factor [Thermoanaerobaculia bacterium]|nr:sigma-70 family RNA polymerase sigma factor [Thermoanaerobaculia bacterium]HUM30983.1 sigma-70 family RNA polymerase sigma factor [Thermoanaerobaculia bacterium]HXK69284.1 sigma-70 family RNA polymerase sigma factor [Thermoanaerobaculia bacterium]
MTRQLDEPTPLFDYNDLRNRKKESVQSWFETYSDAVYTFIYYRVGRDSDLASDLTQETFLVALRRLESFDPARGSMLPWLTYMARNQIRKTLKRRRRFFPIFGRSEKEPFHRGEFARWITQTPLPDDLLQNKEVRSWIAAALASLPGRYRNILLRFYHEERSIRDIAEHEGISESNVKVLLHRARGALRAILTETDKEAEILSGKEAL